MNMETGERLIRRLIEWKHWSPLEMASATMEIETTRDIARQLLRHRSFSFQEFSQRYADPTEGMENVYVERKARLQDPKNRQNSIIHDDLKLHDAWAVHQRAVWQRAMTAYKWAIENGIAKEQARAVLPEGNTLSRLYANGTLRSWVHYIELRSANGTQLEHIHLAKACAEAIATIFPMAGEFVND
jgi:thymidylate synthase (FAD)